MQVPDEIRKCVMFICFNSNDEIRYAGTAFIVGVMIDSDNLVCYIVTARHVIESIRDYSIDKKVLLRLYKKEGGVIYVEFKVDNWILHPTDDVAILNWTPSEKIIDYRVILSDMIVSPELIEQQQIGVGEEIFLTGLFANHYGEKKNIPIMRVGNIAAMPEEKIYVKKFGLIDAYLIGVRSIGGFSGSPVFVYLGSWRLENGSMKLGGRKSFYWLGVMHGHYDKDILEMDGLTPDMLRNIRINMGIAIVTPAHKVMDLINRKDFLEARGHIKNNWKRKHHYMMSKA